MMLMEFAKTIKLRYPSGKAASWQTKVKSLTFIRYADDFIVTHQDLNVIKRCQELISDWLSDMGLELKPSKTRIAHTLQGEKSEDGIAGFDFLGYNIRQYPVSKYKSPKNPQGELLGFRTLIVPSKEACKKHQVSIKNAISKHKKSPQALLIRELNPIIRGWCNYYKLSDANTVKCFSKQDFLVMQKLRAWGVNRCGNYSKACKKYLHKIGNRITFATGKMDANPLKLLAHDTFSSSSTEYVKVKGDKSPYDGDLIYWSARMGRSNEMPQNKAFLLKKQKGKCNWCGLHFRNGDVLENDHIKAISLGGTNEYANRQLLHAHCHDEKTAIDLIQIKEKRSAKFFDELSQLWSRTNYRWIDDIPVIIDS